MNDPASRVKRPRAAMMALLFTIAATVLVIDQFTKFLAVTLLEDQPPVPVIGSLAGFTFYRNPGAALGLGSNVTWIFPIIAIGVFIAILVISRKLGSRAWATGLGLLLGGLFGNLVDRLFREPAFLHGAVVDFIDLSLFICNVADIAISAAAVTLVIVSLRGIDIDGSDSTRVKEDTHD
ncbi:signal peptidase II [Brevibacterium sp. CFH 10365]|uniref:signal peptidase II n=1 Tax=Brevibacterium sp. CFH 10365 TaxID=2585207 RepID=UPI0012662E78|nr:signal peptidase II [Brevibacterium sp. CFH 10365]